MTFKFVTGEEIAEVMGAKEAEAEILPPGPVVKSDLIRGREAVIELTETLALDIMTRQSKGDTFVEIVAWLVKTQGYSIQLAQKAIDFVIKQTLGAMDHTTWTNTYRLMAQDLYQRNIREGKTSAANQVLNNMIKLQYLSQAMELQTRNLKHQENKLDAAIKLLPDGTTQIESSGGKSGTQGFRIAIESYAPETPIMQRLQPLETVDANPIKVSVED